MIIQKKRKASLPFLIGVLILLTLVSAVFVLCLGAVRIPVEDTFRLLRFIITGGEIPDDLRTVYRVVWLLRAPRVILGFAAGCGLALCGTVMQATVQNPMADPYILGISAGATLGATASIFLGAGTISGFSAFAGAAIACVFVLAMASKGGKATPAKLVLSGMVANALFQAFSNFIISMAGDSEGNMTIKFWTMGSLASAGWDNIWLPVVVVALGVIFFLTQYRPLNTLLVGEEAAATLGMNLSVYRALYLGVISLITGILVANCGMIGFVGLIIPHISRAVVGPNHQRLVPITVLVGGIFMMWVDAVARSLIENTELPVGIFTALVGAPVFVYILLRRNYSFSGE